MRKPRYIRRAEEITVDKANYNGGTGEINFGLWKGSVIWGANENGWEHVSVAPYNHEVVPSWNDMCRLKDIFFDEEEMVLQFHPRKSQYVNIVGNCLHLWRPKDQALLERLEGRP